MTAAATGQQGRILEHLFPQGNLPESVAVLGIGTGIGTTSAAMRLAEAFCDSGARTIYVDADTTGRPWLPALCRGEGLGDLLRGTSDVHELLRRGPGGMQILPGMPRRKGNVPEEELRLELLWNRLGGLARHCDTVVADFGDGRRAAARRGALGARALLVVGPATEEALLQAYAVVKLLRARRTDPPRLAWIPPVDVEPDGDLPSRFAATCRKFLGCEIPQGYWLPQPEPEANEAPGGPLERPWRFRLREVGPPAAVPRAQPLLNSA